MDETRESIDYQRVSEHSFFIYHICILNVCIGRFIMTKASIPIDGLVLGDRWASIWWSNCTRWGWCSGWIRRNCQGKFYTLNIFIFEIHVFIIWLNSCEYEINNVRIFYLGGSAWSPTRWASWDRGAKTKRYTILSYFATAFRILFAFAALKGR